MSTEHLAHDLLLLIPNLSQLKSPERILTVFLEALNRAQADIHLQFLPDGGRASTKTIEIATAQNSFGWITLEGELDAQPNELLVLIRNAVCMLAIILENRAQERLLADDKSQLEEAVRERTAELLRANEQLKSEIAERTHTEQALQESEERYRDLINALPSSVLVVQHEHYVFTNPAGARMLSLSSPEEVVGIPALEPIAPGSRELVVKRMEELADGKENPPVEIEIQRSDGITIWTEYTSVPIMLQGEPAALIICRDITEHKRSEEALHRERDRAQKYLDVAGVMLVVLNELGEITLINRRGCQILGYDEKALVGQNWFDTCLPPRMREKVKAVFQRLITGEIEPVEYYENPVLTSSGEERIIAWHNIVLTDEAGRITSTLSSGEDITARERTEKALRESEEQYRLLFENMLDGFAYHEVLFDENGQPNDYCFLEMNDAFETLTGLKREDVIGKTVTQVLPGIREGEFDWVQAYGNVALTGKGASFELHSEPLDQWYTISAYSPRKGYFATIFTNTTERVRAEKERERLLTQIQEHAQRVQQIVDTVPEGVLLLDADGRIVLVNPAAEKDLATLTGVRVGGIPTHLGDRPLPELLTSPPKGLWHNVTIGDQDLQIIARSIEAGPTLGGWVLVIRDVTQQREIERRIQQQERLAAVGQLAAGIAHDFNNVMATIVLYAQMTAQTDGLPPRVQERMQTINEQANHATRLIRQILDFSRRSVIERHPLDLSSFLKEQIQLLERTLPESIAVKLSYGSDEYAVNADPTRIQQMVTNLAVNARDAMPEGGELHIGLERVRIEPYQKTLLPEIETGEWIQITVSDTGTGIPSDVLPHIFDPFFTTKEPGEGSGLGLAQVHGIVGSHKGHITVDTKLGEGTTFTIYLPVLPQPPLEPSTLEIPSLVQGQGETILIVEDNAVAREALVESLKQLNYQVIEAANGRQALAILEQRADEIALVLSDVVMPEMGGIALLYNLRQQRATVPMVLLTGHPMEEELKSLRAQGLSDWLLKPPQLGQLAEVIAQALKRG